MKILKKIFRLFGYSLSKKKKSNDIIEIIKLNLENLECDLLIDVGANKGDFSYEFVNNFNQIFLFEPNPNLQKKLKERFQKFKHVKIFDFGIDKKNSIKQLNITSDTGETLSSIKKQNINISKNLKNNEITSQENIKLFRLDYILKQNNISIEKIFLKTDTQGNELEVMESLGEFIGNIKFIKCEMSILPLYDISYDHWTLMDFLKKNSFNPIFFENGLRNDIGEMIEYDIFCKKKFIEILKF